MSATTRFAALVFACLLFAASEASAWNRGAVQRFATLPPGSPNPEGITVDRNGDVYVTGFNPTGAGAGLVFVFGDNGQLRRVLEVAGASSALLGIAFHPSTGDLLVV